jgi:hypothetical protein
MLETILVLILLTMAIAVVIIAGLERAARRAIDK